MQTTASAENAQRRNGTEASCAARSTTNEKEKICEVNDERKRGKEKVTSRAGCVSFQYACTAATPTRRPLLAARWCRFGSRTLEGGEKKVSFVLVIAVNPSRLDPSSTAEVRETTAERWKGP
jgi:hypothetical protein